MSRTGLLRVEVECCWHMKTHGHVTDDFNGVDVCEKAQQKLRPSVKRLEKWKEKSKRDGERMGGAGKPSRVGLRNTVKEGSRSLSAGGCWHSTGH